MARCKQVKALLNGNEAVAKAIIHIGYDGEGYYPITPSSDAGENVTKAYAKGETDVTVVPGNSELAAISICAGFALAGTRVVDVSSANGILLKMEQLPAMSGLRLPMVLNIATRDVSGPLNIKNGHSDLMACLGVGWPILTAKTVQEAYDLNIIALKLAEAVDLPVIVAYDGFHTSHGIRRVQIFEDPQDVRNWLGPKKPKFSFLDVHNPKTYGPYMNDDLINNKYQLHLAMQEAYRILPRLFEEYADLTGRRYDFVDAYRMDDAQTAIFILNSAAEVSKVAIDMLREQGEKVGGVYPTVLRPFPEKEITELLKDRKAVMVAERADEYGARGSYLYNEIGAALQAVGSGTKLLSRVYGIGGLNVTPDDALNLIRPALKAAKGDEVEFFDYYGHWEGDPSFEWKAGCEPLKEEEQKVNEKLGDKVNLRELTKMPKRISKTSACPGCGIFTNLELFLKGIDGHVCLGFNTGCGMVVTTGYPQTSFKVNYFHNLFHNGASTMSGVVTAYEILKKRGVINDEITFIMVGGDGSGDIGMDQLIGAAIRNHPFIYFEYDNQIYANTGAQLCFTAFMGARTATSHVGPKQVGKTFHHKDSVQIMRGTHAPYIATVAECNPVDMIRKARKAQKTVREGGFVYIKAFSVCPLNWGLEESRAREIVQKVVDSCLFPLYEIEKGITTITYDPKDKKIPVVEAFSHLGALAKHLANPKHKEIADKVQAEVDRRWRALKAMHENPDL